MTQIFFIPFKFPSLNDYIAAMNNNRHAGNNMKQEFTDIAAKYAMSLRKIEPPVHIMFTYREANTKRDPDNITFAKKFILDGLVKAGKLPDDSQKYIRNFSEFWEINPDDVGVEVMIEEVDA